MKMIAKAKCEKCGRTIPVSELLRHKCEGEVPKHLRDVPEDNGVNLARYILRHVFNRETAGYKPSNLYITITFGHGFGLRFE